MNYCMHLVNVNTAIAGRFIKPSSHAEIQGLFLFCGYFNIIFLYIVENWPNVDYITKVNLHIIEKEYINLTRCVTAVLEVSPFDIRRSLS